MDDAKTLWARRAEVIDSSARARVASDFVNGISAFWPGVREGGMQVILGWRYRAR